MDQKTRNKIAMALSAVLVPLMIFLLIRNIGQARKKRRGSARRKGAPAAVIPDITSIPEAPPAPTLSKVGTAAPEIDPEVLKEQKKIAALLPKHNPFDASRRPQTMSPRVRAKVKKKVKLRVDGIMGREGSRMAIINGRVLKVGESIEGWTVLEINSSGVILDDGTEKITLPLRR